MEQHERTVVDGTHYHMHVRHLTPRGTNYEIGRRLGEIARERHERDPDTHLRGDLRYVRTRRHYLQQTYPLHWERSGVNHGRRGCDDPALCMISRLEGQESVAEFKEAPGA